MKTVEYPTTYIAWDLETSGLDGTKDKILEIGLFKVVNGEVVEKKRWVLDNQIEIPEHITAINGMTKEIIAAEGRSPRECFTEMLNYIRESEANLTHNGIKFDIGFLVEQMHFHMQWDEKTKEAFRSHLEKTAIDTAVIFKARLHGFKRNWNESFHDYSKRVMEAILRGKYNLGVCCDELGIDRSQIVQHRALGDVELTHHVYKALLALP